MECLVGKTQATTVMAFAALSVEKGSAVEQAGRAGVWGRLEEALFQTGDCLSSEPDEILIYQVPHTVADR